MNRKSALNTSLFRARLKLKHIQSENLLTGHHPRAVALLEAAGVRPGGLRVSCRKTPGSRGHGHHHGPVTISVYSRQQLFRNQPTTFQPSPCTSVPSWYHFSREFYLPLPDRFSKLKKPK